MCVCITWLSHFSEHGVERIPGDLLTSRADPGWDPALFAESVSATATAWKANILLFECLDNDRIVATVATGNNTHKMPMMPLN